MRNTSFDKLIEVVATLRSPNGCPWDKEQNYESMVPQILEEVYELIDAVDKKDCLKIKDELGDVLLHVVMFSQIASENNDFTVFDVCQNIKEKLIRRHPHVFSDTKINEVEDIIKNWENIKQKEKGNEDRKSVLDGVPESFPALLRAYKLGKKAAQKGFDFASSEDAFCKVSEEVEELKEELFKTNKDSLRIEEELGDLLFAICNLSRKLNINPEIALNKASEKFYNRFIKLEEEVSNQGKDLDNMNLQEMDIIWEAVKKLKN